MLESLNPIILTEDNLLSKESTNYLIIIFLFYLKNIL